jgi:hypothetical protein
MDKNTPEIALNKFENKAILIDGYGSILCIKINSENRFVPLKDSEYILNTDIFNRPYVISKANNQVIDLGLLESTDNELEAKTLLCGKEQISSDIPKSIIYLK